MTSLVLLSSISQMCASKSATQKQGAPDWQHSVSSTGQARDDLRDGAGNVLVRSS